MKSTSVSRLSDLVKTEVTDLIALGECVVEDATQSDGLDHKLATRATTWITRTGKLLQQIYKYDSYHRQMFDKILKKYDFARLNNEYYHHSAEVLGILKSVEHELNKGLIFDFAKLIEASIFDDFLEMAEYLLKQKYKDAAAVLVGGVLEDTLRKLAQRNGISTIKENGKPLTIEPYNMKLAQAGVYDKLIQKQITAWADVRNEAAHGNYDAYTLEDVKKMLQFVKEFVTEFMG